MSNQKDLIKIKCEAAIQRLMLAKENHENGRSEDLSLEMIDRILNEIQIMIVALSPQVFRPTFGKFILDWPDEHGLISLLSELSYRYERM